MNRAQLVVAIVDDTRLEKCEGDCGADWSLKENLEAARQALEGRFGHRVRLSFYDLARPGDCPAQIEERVRSGQHALPLLVIEGEPRVAGYFDIRMLSDLVEAQLEMDHA